MKAGMNGVINLSVLDGWWGEGYEEGNGWGIKPAKVMDEGRRNHEDASALYELLEDQVIPLYYARGNTGFSAPWISIAKRSMATILPKFNASRMVGEYVSKFYVPASRQGRRFAADDARPASELAAWKANVRDGWPRVSIRRIDEPKRRIQFGERMEVEVAVHLGALKPSDVVVELVLDRGVYRPDSTSRVLCLPLMADGSSTEAGEARFVLGLEPEVCGQLQYRIRCFPHHELLTHRFELGLTLWV
jgi:starch phosphorylase